MIAVGISLRRSPIHDCCEPIDSLPAYDHWMTQPMTRILLALLTFAMMTGAAAPSLADDEKRWDKKSCDLFTQARKAKICTLQAITGFAPLSNEPAQLIADQVVKSCDWAWRDLYDRERERHLLGPNANFDGYLKSWASTSLILVLESRLPAGNPRPRTDVERDIIRVYSEKLLTDCGESK